MKRPPRARAAITAREAVQAALQFHKLADDVRGERVIAEWTELVGPRIAQRTRPDRIADRVLWVEVATSPWLHELTLLKPQLLRGLLERLGEPALFDDLRLKLAGARPAPPRPAGGAAAEARDRRRARGDRARGRRGRRRRAARADRAGADHERSMTR